MTNTDVIDVKTLHHQGKIDQSLKLGIEILSSNQTLATIDSFNVYKVMAFNLSVLKNHELALEYAEKAVKIVNSSFSEGSKFENSKWISPLYADVGQYKAAIEILKNDLLITKDTLSTLKLYNDIGFYYYKDKLLDSAIFYFEKVIKSNKKSDQLLGLVGLATGNLGAVYLAKEEYSKALEYLKIDAEINKNRYTSSYYNAMNAIAECYFKMENYKEAIKTLDILDHIREEDFNKIDPASILKKNIRLIQLLKW